MPDLSPTARGALLVAAALTVAALVGCVGETGAPGSPTPPAGASAETVPEPGRTIAASPTSSEATDGSLRCYRIAVVADGTAESAAALLAAARELASTRGMHLDEFIAAGPGSDAVATALDQAINADPDLVVGAGESVVDVFSFETAQRLDRQFLIVGAQLAEPTGNVTAVIWDGATSRGSAASADGPLDSRGVTEERGRAALAAGIGSVVAGTTGVVLLLGH